MSGGDPTRHDAAPNPSGRGAERGEALLAALGRGDLAEARRLARLALADPAADLRATHAVLGRLEAALGDLRSAISHYERALKLAGSDPTADADTALQLAWLLREEAPERARELLLPLVDPDPRHAASPQTTPGESAREVPAWVPVLLGDLAETLHADRGEAARWFRRGLAATAPESPERAILLGRLAVASPDPDEAQAAAAELAELAPSAVAEPEVYELTLRRLLSDGLAQAPTADRLIAGLASLPGGLLPARKLHIQLARERGELPLARGLAEALRAYDPSDLEGLRLAGELALLDGDLALAGALLGELELAQSHLPPDTALAWADALRQQGRHAEGREIVARLVEREPEHGGAWLELSRLDVDRGREDDALVALRRAAELDPEIDLHAGRVHHLLRQVLGELPAVPALAGNLEIVRVRFGHNAIVIQLHTRDGERFLKCFLPGRRSGAHLQAVGELMNALADLPEDARGGLAIPRILASADGLVHRVGPTEALLMTSAPGLSLRRSLAHPRAHMREAHGLALGRAAATLARALAALPPIAAEPHGLRSGVLQALAWTREPATWRAFVTEHGLERRAPREVDALGAHLERLAAPLAAVAADPRLQPTLVHGDFGWHNVLWDLGDERVAITAAIDFDYAGLDLPLVDFANALLRTAFDWKRLDSTGDPRPRADLARALVTGYREGGGVLPERALFEAVMQGTRLQYYATLAATSLAAEADRQSPRGYNRAQDTLAVLLQQLRWLERHDSGPWLG